MTMKANKHHVDSSSIDQGFILIFSWVLGNNLGIFLESFVSSGLVIANLGVVEDLKRNKEKCEGS